LKQFHYYDTVYFKRNRGEERELIIIVGAVMVVIPCVKTVTFRGSTRFVLYRVKLQTVLAQVRWVSCENKRKSNEGRRNDALRTGANVKKPWFPGVN